MISLKEVHEDNFHEIIRLSHTLDDYQKTCVADNVVSLAQAYLHPHKAWPRAIYQDEQLVGFLMLDLSPTDIKEEDQPAYYLWRFMIAKPYQKQRIGRQVLNLLVEKCRNEGVRYLYTSCEIAQEQPYRFYINFGFIDTHEFDGEQILKYPI